MSVFWVIGKKGLSFFLECKVLIVYYFARKKFYSPAWPIWRWGMVVCLMISVWSHTMTRDKSRCLECRISLPVNNQDAWVLRIPVFRCESVSPGVHKGTLKRSFLVEREFWNAKGLLPETIEMLGCLEYPYFIVNPFHLVLTRGYSEKKFLGWTRVLKCQRFKQWRCLGA